MSGEIPEGPDAARMRARGLRKIRERLAAEAAEAMKRFDPVTSAETITKMDAAKNNDTTDKDKDKEE